MESYKNTNGFNAVIFLDNDGPINDLLKTGGQITNTQLSGMRVTNLPYLAATLKFLEANNVLIVAGSQRMTYSDADFRLLSEIQTRIEKENEFTQKEVDALNEYYEKKGSSVRINYADGLESFNINLNNAIEGEKKAIQLKEDFIVGCDENFGKERKFLRRDHIETIVQNLGEGQGKVPLLNNVKKVFGVPADRIFHVDDDAKYQKTTGKEGYQFIFARRTKEEVGYFSFQDNQYLANMLNIVVIPDMSIDWESAMRAIDSAKLEDFADDPKIAAELKDLMKLNFALHKVMSEQFNPKSNAEKFRIVFEDYFIKLKKEFGRTNPALLFDYLDFVSNPDPKMLNDFKKGDINAHQVDSQLMLDYATYPANKLFDNIPPEQTLKIIGHTALNTISDKIFALLRDESKSLDARQQDVKHYLSSMIQNADSTFLVAYIGVMLLNKRETDFKALFEKRGVELFSITIYSGVGFDIISACKDKLLELAMKKKDENVCQRLLASNSYENYLLHFHQDKFQKPGKYRELTGHEKKLIEYMVESKMNLPNTVSAAPIIREYYNEKVEEQRTRKQFNQL